MMFGWSGRHAGARLVLKAVCMVLVGLLLATVGTDQDTGAPRFTFGIPDLIDGVDFIPVAMGCSASPTFLFRWLRSANGAQSRPPRSPACGRAVRNFAKRGSRRCAARRSARCSACCRAVARPSARSPATPSRSGSPRHPEKFGHGAVEGVAGPLTANNAAAQTAFIPLLTLGIPSNAVLAIMAASMTIHGITPGPSVMSKTPELFWGMIASMWIGNLMLLILNLPLIGIWVKLLSAPYRLLYPAILLFCAVGVYSVRNNVHDVGIMTLFGLIGYLLIRLEADLAPLLLGLVLGPMMEQNLRRAMVIADGDWTVFVRKPISAALLAAAAALVIVIILPSVRRVRDATRAIE